MGRKRFFLIGIIIVTTLRIQAQTGASSFEFVENKGQWDNRVKYKGELSSGAFFLENKGFTVLLHHPQDMSRLLNRGHEHAKQTSGKRSGIKVNSKTIVAGKSSLDHQPEKLMILRSHAYQVSFQGSNDKLQIVPDKPVPSNNNYFIGNDPSKWVSNAKIFQAVVYKNVYPAIDIRYYSENGKLKYDLIVHPGGNVNNIALKYDGVDKLAIRNNELIVTTSVGQVKELYPYSFQFDATKGRTEVACKYVLTGNNTVKFQVSNYSKNATLVIDPALVFASFTGSTASQFGFTATPGPDGSFYSGGIVFGQGFPTTNGAFQTSFQGGGTMGIDIGIMKFSPNGSSRVYATYIGGSEDEAPHSLFCDPQGNLVVMGRTYATNISANNYPGTLVGPGGSADIVVTKLNATGSALIGSLRIGGAGIDGVNIEDMQRSSRSRILSLVRNYGDDSRSEVILDGANNIYVAAQTQSGNFPIIGGGFQGTLGGKQDGVVLKINPNCTNVIWSSFLGGDEDDGAFVLALNTTNGNLYVAGATSSGNFPGNKTGTIGSGYQGGEADGYVTIISNDGSTQLKTTFLGTNNVDIIYGIQFDRVGFPYVMGVSRGSWPVQNVAYSVAGSKQFVSKLQPDLSSYVYSTVFGSGAGKPNMSPVAFLVDRCENVYISGWGGWISEDQEDPFDMAGVAGMPVTPDAIKSSTDNRDFYFIVIQRNATGLLYGSFFGQDGASGEHVDGGTSRFDQQGVIYQAMCANCFGGASFPTTPGVVGPTNPSNPPGCNLAAVKISFNFSGVASGPKVFANGVPDSVGCVPFTVNLRDTVRNAKLYEWRFGDGTPDQVTTDFQINHTFQAVGNYTVRLIAIDSSTCNVRDTAYINVVVRDDLAQLDFNAVKLPPCESLSYRFDNLSIAPATKPFGPTSFTWDFGDGTRIQSGTGAISHSYTSAGTYIVKLILTDIGYCNAPDSLEQEIRIAPLVKAQFETPAAGCVPHEAVFTNTSLAGQQFFWDFGDGSTSTDVNPTHLYLTPGTFRVKLLAIDPATCNVSDSTEQSISINIRPTADFTHTPVTPEVNTPTVFYNQSTGGARYKWLFGDGDSAVRNTMDTVIHQYNATGTYQACLITYNQFDCTDTICKPVQAEVIPVLDVPNAFTPGKFGRNSIIRVEGFGINRMTWRIFNRWGQKVFESTNRTIGWDGTYNGQLQPMDVYVYTLDVEFSDGTKTRKTGDITLIR